MVLNQTSVFVLGQYVLNSSADGQILPYIVTNFIPYHTSSGMAYTVQGYHYHYIGEKLQYLLYPTLDETFLIQEPYHQHHGHYHKKMLPGQYPSTNIVSDTSSSNLFNSVFVSTPHPTGIRIQIGHPPSASILSDFAPATPQETQGVSEQFRPAPITSVKRVAIKSTVYAPFIVNIDCVGVMGFLVLGIPLSWTPPDLAGFRCAF